MNSTLPRPPAKQRPENPSSQPWDLNRAILASPLAQSAKVLLLVIVDHARHGRSKCTASTDTLARESGLTGRHVRRLLPAIEKSGWIQVERATGSRQSRHTIYLAPRNGSASFVRLHEVGHSGSCSRTSEPPSEVPITVGVKGGEKVPDSRFAPIQQNCNLPVAPVPDDDPALSAAMWARGLKHLVAQSRIAAAPTERT